MATFCQVHSIYFSTHCQTDTELRLVVMANVQYSSSPVVEILSKQRAPLQCDRIVLLEKIKIHLFHKSSLMKMCSLPFDVTSNFIT